MKILFSMIAGIFAFAFKFALIAILLMVVAVACVGGKVADTIDNKTYNASTQ